MSRLRDYYRILHVQPDAPTAIISASYRTLMQRLRNHPDLGGDHENAVLLNEAHAVLTDPERRAAYDARRAGAAAAAADPPSAPAASDPTELFAAARCIFCGAPHGMERALVLDDECGRCSSPLFPAERQRLDYSGQRMLARIPKHMAASLYTAWPQSAAHDALVLDMSLNGARLATSVRLQPGQVVKIDCAVCRALARVAHSRRDPAAAGGWLVGLEFLTLRFASSRGSFVSTSA